ncbi:MAG: MBL fold metallo-hydrolase [Ignavibacteriales bacterium]|nr:MBL fold metallo-hydrolase [Ignavibacteriales bacterium]
MSNSITLINHATILLRLGSINLLTDPILTRTVSFILPRLQKAGLSFEELPPIHSVLISHNHYDHLNLKTLRRIRRTFSPIVVFPTGVARYGRRVGFKKVVELGWGESFSNDGMTITCVPAKHFSGRLPWDRNRSLFCGYVIQANGCTVYFAGDSGYAPFFRELGKLFAIDVALLPIGAYRPQQWFKGIHMSPGEAVQAFLDLGAKHFIPIHWGTFKISDEPMSEPPILVRQEALAKGVEDRVHILRNGETFSS